MKRLRKPVPRIYSPLLALILLIQNCIFLPLVYAEGKDSRMPLMVIFPSHFPNQESKETWSLQLEKFGGAQNLQYSDGRTFTLEQSSLKGSIGFGLKYNDRLHLGAQIPIALLSFSYPGLWINAQYDLLQWERGKFSLGVMAGLPLSVGTQALLIHNIIPGKSFAISVFAGTQIRYYYRSFSDTDFQNSFINSNGDTDFARNSVDVSELTLDPLAGLNLSLGPMNLGFFVGWEKLLSQSVRSEDYSPSNYQHQSGLFAGINITCSFACMFEGLDKLDDKLDDEGDEEIYEDDENDDSEYE